MGGIQQVAAHRAPAAGGFTPASLFGGGEAGDFWDGTDLSKLWVVAGSVNATAVADVISRWDGSVNGRQWIQTSVVQRPTYQALGIKSDGSDDIMACVLPADITVGTLTAAARVRFVAFPSSASFFGIGPDIGTNVWDAIDRGSFLFTEDQGASKGRAGAYRNNMYASVTDDAALDLGVTYNLISIWDGTDHTVYLDGTAYTSVAQSGSFAADTLSLFAEPNGAPTNMYVKAALVINRALNSTERSNLNAYMAALP